MDGETRTRASEGGHTHTAVSILGKTKRTKGPKGPLLGFGAKPQQGVWGEAPTLYNNKKRNGWDDDERGGFGGRSPPTLGVWGEAPTLLNKIKKGNVHETNGGEQLVVRRRLRPKTPTL